MFSIRLVVLFFSSWMFLSVEDSSVHIININSNNNTLELIPQQIMALSTDHGFWGLGFESHHPPTINFCDFVPVRPCRT